MMILKKIPRPIRSKLGNKPVGIDGLNEYISEIRGVWKNTDTLEKRGDLGWKLMTLKRDF